jgi:hypothetical protein
MSIFDIRIHLETIREIVVVAESHTPPEELGHEIRRKLPGIKEAYDFLSMQKYAMANHIEETAKYARAKNTRQN